MNINFYIDDFRNHVDQKFSQLVDENIVKRIWEKDHTVWSNKPDEITNRLGWLHSPEVVASMAGEIKEFVASVSNSRFDKVLLMGMGGSSLAPEVFSLSFGGGEEKLTLKVIDSTHPEAVLKAADEFDPANSLYIVSTKSGGTIETISFLKYFYNHSLKIIESEHTSKHFVAITDPGSGLEDMAKELKFRKIFLNDPDIGGRFSALSLFGMVPAAVLGIDIEKLLSKAKEEAELCKLNEDSAYLGVLMGVLAEEGIDKLTFIMSEKIKSFASWAEQLVAESTGKNGKGILPVDGEEILGTEYYSKDRLFVVMRLRDDESLQDKIKILRESKTPMVEIILDDEYDFGREFFRWEFATAVCGWVLKLNPFDQPNVESAKVIARNIITKYKEEGKLNYPKVGLSEGIITILGENSGTTVQESINNILKYHFNAKHKSYPYISIQAFIKPDEKTDKVLSEIRLKLQKKYKTAVTLGYGPRYLHSTGQLHKGDSGNGLFMQILSGKFSDTKIPDEPVKEKSSVTFGVLVNAQALGDRQALIENQRNVITLQINSDIIEGLQLINSMIQTD